MKMDSTNLKENLELLYMADINVTRYNHFGKSLVLAKTFDGIHTNDQHEFMT